MKRLYLRLLTERPVATKTATGLTTAVLGDLGCQWILTREKREAWSRTKQQAVEHSDPEKDESWFDQRRSIQFAVFGATITGFGQHYWFEYLGNRFPTSTAGLFRSTLYKLIAHQAFFAPFLLYPTFYAIGSVVTTLEVEQYWEQVKRDHMDIQLVNWGFWIPLQAIQFSLIPRQLHVLCAASAGTFFSGILSFLSNRKLNENDISHFMA